MRRFLAALICAICVAPHAFAMSSIKGSELLRWCEADTSKAEWFACQAYLNGVLDALITQKSIEEQLGLKATICVPNALDPTLVRRMFMAFANQHLNTLTYAGSAVVIGALGEQYPCP